VAFEVEVEDVTPGAVAARARLELGQVDVLLGEPLERRKQAARLVADAKNDAGFVGDLAARRFFGGDDEETGVVEVEVFDPLGQNFQPVNLGRPLRGDRRQPRLRVFGQLFGGSGGVVDRNRLQLVLGQKTIALRKGLRMADDPLDIFQLDARRRQQVVAHPQVGLTDHVQVGVEQQVVSLVDAAGHGVLDRHHADVGPPLGNRLEDLVKGWQTQRFVIGGDGERGFFAECASGSLVGGPSSHKPKYTYPMVRFLEGVVLEVANDRMLVSLHGLGFEVFCPVSTLAKLRVGETARLHTRLVVREDSLTLYGFHDARLLEWFDLLVGVSGVGPRVALGILSTLPLDLLGQAISGEDAKLLTAAPGVGKKLAERLVLELKNKLPEHLAGLTASAAPTDNPAAGEAAAALITLGFREAQVHAVVQKLAAKKPEANAEELIRLALRELR